MARSRHPSKQIEAALLELEGSAEWLRRQRGEVRMDGASCSARPMRKTFAGPACSAGCRSGARLETRKAMRGKCSRRRRAAS